MSTVAAPMAEGKGVWKNLRVVLDLYVVGGGGEGDEVLKAR